MVTDLHGNSLTGATPEAADLFNQALTAFNLYRGDPFSLIDTALAEAPGFAMGYLLKAHLYGLSTEPGATAAVADLLATARALPLNEREASHLKAVGLAAAGDWTAAAKVLDRHNLKWPHDLLAIQSGHLMDFFRANARNLRDRIARVLPKWSPDMPGYSLLLGMHAFGLEETADYARAEETGRRALSVQPLDCWAHHAVAHVMEMQGRAEDGIGWMTAREPHWTGEDNFFRVHNWWHKALYHLDLGQTAEVLALYDGPIRANRSAVAVDMIDASAMLWRLSLTGQDVGGRWQELAEAWQAHADGATYPFNDWHAAMALLGSGDEAAVERLLTACRTPAEGAPEATRWGQKTAVPLIEGFRAFWHGNYEQAVNSLWGVRYIANTFGGSHAQRDLIDWTLTEAAVRSGLKDVAQGLAAERLALKPLSPVNLSLMRRAAA